MCFRETVPFLEPFQYPYFSSKLDSSKNICACNYAHQDGRTALVSLSTSDLSEKVDMELSTYKFCSNEDSSSLTYPFMSGGLPAQ